MNIKEIRAIQDEYERMEGTVTGEVITRLWDHGRNCWRKAHCVVIDLGRRPPVTPHVLTREDRELLALRGYKARPTPEVPRNASTDTPALRLHEWLKTVGATTHREAAAAINIPESKAKQLLINNAHLFKFWKKIAGQSYFIAV